MIQNSFSVVSDIKWKTKEAIQVTIKYDKQFVVFDGIPRNARFSELLSLIKARLGSKIPVNASLMESHRFLRLNETIEEVRPMACIFLSTERNI